MRPSLIYLRTAHPGWAFLLGIAKILLVAAVLFFLFAIGFTGSQSLILAVVGTAFYVMSGRPWPEVPFVPYRVEVKPKLQSIATDFELIEDTEEAWAKLWKDIQKLPRDSPSYACRPYFSFSFSYLHSGLVYNHSTNSFVPRDDVRATLEPLRLPLKGTDDTFQSPPILRFRGVLSIELPKGHWEAIRHREAFKNIDGKRDVSGVGDGDTVEVTLTVIHVAEYQVHLVPSWEEAAVWAHKRREKFRARFGWEGDERDPHAAHFHWDEDTYAHVAEHKYFTLKHWAL